MQTRSSPALWMCVVYFAFYAGIASWSPYITLYYQQIGLSGGQIGILTAVIPLGMAFFAPFWGSVADARNRHRLILRIALVATAVVALLLAVTTSFWQALPLILVFAVLGTTASPLIDSYGMTISARQGIGFGRLRVWGSIGYTLVVWLVGTAMGGSVSPLFLLCYALTLSITAIATVGLPQRREQPTRARWDGVAGILSRTDVRTLLVTVFLLAISTTPVFALFGIYVRELGGDTRLLGTSSALAALSELPVLFLGSRLIARLGSRRMLIIALCIYSVRIMLYGVVPSATWVLGIQLLHGVSFGIYLMASVTMVHELVGSRLAATAQGLLASAMAFGQMSGALAAGILLDRIGIVAIYRLSAGIVLLALAVFVLGTRWFGAPATPAPAVLEQPGER